MAKVYRQRTTVYQHVLNLLPNHKQILLASDLDMITTCQYISYTLIITQSSIFIIPYYQLMYLCTYVHSMLICNIEDNCDIIHMNYAEIRRFTLKNEKHFSQQIHQTHT